VGDEVLVNGNILTSGGGAVMPLGFLVRRSPDGTALAGEVFFGRTLAPDALEEMRGKGRPITGESLAARATKQESSAGAGR
jgi:hypothetical protein